MTPENSKTEEVDNKKVTQFKSIQFAVYNRFKNNLDKTSKVIL